ncbi:MAG TPA: hypothetical protein VHV47_14925 [Opitutaceae bacterium]|jgi:hypothetical protein|nr:hypothetical protein [Opitutaceae bacterium]
MPKKGRIYVNQSVSFPPGMLAEAKKRARNLGLSFSGYIQKCLERDLADRGAIIFREYAEPAALAVAEPAKPAAESPRGRPRK